MNTNYEDGLEIDLRELFSYLIRKMWIIILFCVITAGLGYGISKRVLIPQYTSTAQLYVVGRTQSLASLSLSDLQIGSQLTQDYMVLVKSRPVLEEVIDNLNLPMNYNDLNGIITMSNPTDTRILKVSVDYPDAFMAKNIVDEIARVSSAKIASIMDMDEPNIVEEGVVEPWPSSPNIRINTIIGGLIGLVISVGTLCVIHLLDDTIKSSEDIVKYLELSTLGTIPIRSEKHSKSKEYKVQEDTIELERSEEV